jgi:hypothetical protein
MRAMRRNPDRMDGRYDPLLVVDANRQQAVQRAEQLSAGVIVRGRDAHVLAGLFDSN